MSVDPLSATLRAQPWWLVVGVATAGLSVFAVITAVIANFALDRGRARARRPALERPCFVSTLSMSLFMLACWLVLLLDIGALALPRSWRAPLALAGAGIMALGAAINIAGRVHLGRQWSDPVRIAEGHRLVDSGPYARVRHPLYASLMLMLAGAALLFGNWLLLAADLIVFVPFMDLRARREEVALLDRLPDYSAYRARTGRFLPRIGGNR